MGRNFDDYPDFQDGGYKIMRNTVGTILICKKITAMKINA
jgi:hypothetical protein